MAASSTSYMTFQLEYKVFINNTCWCVLLNCKVDATPLSWCKRHAILKNAFKGLIYLHSATPPPPPPPPPMVHQDIKSWVGRHYRQMIPRHTIVLQCKHLIGWQHESKIGRFCFFCWASQDFLWKNHVFICLHCQIGRLLPVRNNVGAFLRPVWCLQFWSGKYLLF